MMIVRRASILLAFRDAPYKTRKFIVSCGRRRLNFLAAVVVADRNRWLHRIRPSFLFIFFPFLIQKWFPVDTFHEQ